MKTGWVVWVNGPYAATRWPYLRIARRYLDQLLDDGEKYITDGGCRDRRAPDIVPTGRHEHSDRMSAYVRAGKEIFDERFKSWVILKQYHRHPLVKHKRVMHLIAIITQIIIANGGKTWDVVYENLA